METKENVRNQIKQQMRKLSAPVIKERIGKRTAHELIGLLYCLLNDNLITEDELMVAVRKVNQVLKSKRLQSGRS